MADSLQEGQFSSYTLECQESLYEPSVLMCIHSHMCSNMHIYVHTHNIIYVYIQIYTYIHMQHIYVCIYMYRL